MRPAAQPPEAKEPEPAPREVADQGEAGNRRHRSASANDDGRICDARQMSGPDPKPSLVYLKYEHPIPITIVVLAGRRELANPRVRERRTDDSDVFAGGRIIPARRSRV